MGLWWIFFDREEILESYIRSERYEAAQEATQEVIQSVTKKNVIPLIKHGKLTVDEIPTFYPKLTPDDIEDIKKEVQSI